MKKKKEKSRSWHMKNCDRLCSLYVRMAAQYEWPRNKVRCFTCHRDFCWTEVDAGHFITRSKMSTRWNALNVQAQCVECNRMYNGVPKIFAIQLDVVYGEGTADELRRLSEETAKYTIDDLKELAEIFKKAIRRLEKY